MSDLTLFLIPVICLILAVIGSMYLGYATPTEAAAVGAFVSVLLAWGYGNLSLETLKQAFHQTTVVSAMILLIVAGHETTALAISWALYLLANDPQAQERARAEARGVLGERVVDTPAPTAIPRSTSTTLSAPA